MDIITCSLCGADMKPGKAALRKNIGAKLAWPFPSDRLFFIPADGIPKSATLVREGRAYEAFMCMNCSALLIPKRV